MTPRALFWSYDPDLPSFRLRAAPLAAELERRGWGVAIDRLPKGQYLRRIAARRADLRASDALLVAKINLAPGERSLLTRWASRVVFDVDDAIWIRKPRAPGGKPGRSPLREWKFSSSCRAAQLVLAGNDYLAARARRAASRVVVAPTGIDLVSYDQDIEPESDGRTVVWIGLPENLPFLLAVRPALARLAASGVLGRLRIVSSAFPDWPEVPIERVPWSAAGEAAALAGAAIGVMPLADDDWSRGKCAFKLLQYMAAGLPTVASPVGQSAEVVVPGETGWWARTDDEWESALLRLLHSAEERRRLGRAGRELVRRRYDAAAIARRSADEVERLLPPERVTG